MSGTTDEASEEALADEDGPRQKYNFEVADLDGTVRDLLQLVEERGETHTSALRKGTGLDRGRLKYRMDKLEERGLVSQEVKRPDAGGQEMRHLALTEKGREAIEAGLLADITDVNTNVANLSQRVAELERDVDKKVDDYVAQHYADAGDEEVRQEITPRIESVETGLAEVEEATADAQSLADRRTSALADRLDDLEADTDTRLADLEDAHADERLDELETRVAGLEAAFRWLHETVGELSDRVEENRETLTQHNYARERVERAVEEEEAARKAAIAEAREELKQEVQDTNETVRNLDRRTGRLKAMIQEIRSELRERFGPAGEQGSDDDGDGLLPW
jgi:chromosome segregation ATPase